MTDPARVPLDHPTPERPHRVYVALTNHCNRACPWCSTYSSPEGRTWITRDQVFAALPATGPYELQLEGGEPTLHPEFWSIVKRARSDVRCTRLVLCTNGVVLPRRPDRLASWLDVLGRPLTVKLSFNHHLLERDPGLADLAVGIRDHFEGDPERLFVLNVRLRRGTADDDQSVRDAVMGAGLAASANIFYLQRYGLGAAWTDWEPPAPVWQAFTLVNPDGSLHGTDLVLRSEAMGRLP